MSDAKPCEHILGDNGYPSDAELESIKHWEGTFGDLLDYIKARWGYPDRFVLEQIPDEEIESHITDRPQMRLYLSTGGWSGNESIIGAFMETFFWMFFWYKSERGGHYWFGFSASAIELRLSTERNEDELPKPAVNTPDSYRLRLAQALTDMKRNLREYTEIKMSIEYLMERIRANNEAEK